MSKNILGLFQLRDQTWLIIMIFFKFHFSNCLTTEITTIITTIERYLIAYVYRCEMNENCVVLIEALSSWLLTEKIKTQNDILFVYNVLLYIFLKFRMKGTFPLFNSLYTRSIVHLNCCRKRVRRHQRSIRLDCRQDGWCLSTVLILWHLSYLDFKIKYKVLGQNGFIPEFRSIRRRNVWIPCARGKLKTWKNLFWDST